MKMKKIVFLLAVVILTGNIFAQEDKSEGKRNFNIEEFKTKQAEYFVKELQLTSDEAGKFTPVMQEYMKKRYEMNKALREAERALKKQESKTSTDYQKAINLIVDTKIKEANLQKDYYNQLSKILAPEKIYKYDFAEKDFVKQVLDKHWPKVKDGKDNKGKDGKPRGRGVSVNKE